MSHNEHKLYPSDENSAPSIIIYPPLKCEYYCVVSHTVEWKEVTFISSQNGYIAPGMTISSRTELRKACNQCFLKICDSSNYLWG